MVQVLQIIWYHLDPPIYDVFYLRKALTVNDYDCLQVLKLTTTFSKNSWAHFIVADLFSQRAGDSCQK
jgi:hypothetical protein